MGHRCFLLLVLMPVCLGLGWSSCFVVGGNILGRKAHTFDGHSFAGDVWRGALRALTAHIVDKRSEALFLLRILGDIPCRGPQSRGPLCL